MKQHEPATAPVHEVSVTATLLRTIILVGLTLLLACLVRFIPPLVHGVQYVAGTDLWQRLYGLLGIDTSLGREQLILVGIMMACFGVALILQTSVTYALSRLRR